MKAGSGYKHLEAGWYDITSEADARLKAEINLNMEGRDVTVKGGSVFVRKKDYEYLIRFVIETDGEAISAIADAKKLYFESEEYASISSGSEGCYLKDQTIRSEILNSVMKYSIYLPEGYDETHEYPVLYILHGMGGANNDWLQDNAGWTGGGSMPAYAKEYAGRTGMDIIIVAPEGKNLFYCNGYENGVNYMSYFFEEFVPFIESEYAIRSERSSRAVGGLSMGGYGSLYYGLLHPEMFSHVYACSAAVSVGGAAPDGGLEKPAFELKGFAKTKELAPGETQTLTINVCKYTLASFNESASAWESAAGTYKVMFGANAADIRATGVYKLKKAESWKVNNVLAPAETIEELSLN